MINRNALFSDETSRYKKPYEPCAGDRVTVRIRTLANDAFNVYVIINGVKHGMKMMPLAKRREIVSVRKDIYFDYFEYSFKCPERQIKYYFEISDEDDVVYYNRLGCVENVQEEYSFSFVPGFHVPDWAKGAVFYQIFPDRFCNGNPDNDVEDGEYYYTGGHVKRIREWNKFPDELGVPIRSPPATEGTGRSRRVCLS